MEVDGGRHIGKHCLGYECTWHWVCNVKWLTSKLAGGPPETIYAPKHLLLSSVYRDQMQIVAGVNRGLAVTEYVTDTIPPDGFDILMARTNA